MNASILRRSVATTIDLAVIVLAVGFMIQRPLIAEPPEANVWAAIALVLLYEPILTAYLCTFGQALMRTRVRRFDTLERITFGRAYIRFFMKYVASVVGAAASRGRVSVWPDGDHRALHDLQADTVVVNSDALDR